VLRKKIGPATGPQAPATHREVSIVTRRKRNYKYKWRSKRANHGGKGARGKVKNWGKKN
jgi:hypothetical protein